MPSLSPSSARAPLTGSATVPWWRRPLLHFLLLGGALFAGQQALQPAAGPEIVVSAVRVEQLMADFELDFRRPPDSDERGELLAAEVEEELLLAHALELGLPRRDHAVSRRLQELVAFLGEDESGVDPVQRALELDLHRRDPHARTLLVDLARMQLAGGGSAAAGGKSGEEPTEEQLREVLSRQGERYRDLPFAEVREALVEVWHAEDRQRRLEEGLDELRRRYRIRIEDPAAGTGPEAET